MIIITVTLLIRKRPLVALLASPRSMGIPLGPPCSALRHEVMQHTWLYCAFLDRYTASSLFRCAHNRRPTLIVLQIHW